MDPGAARAGPPPLPPPLPPAIPPTAPDAAPHGDPFAAAPAAPASDSLSGDPFAAVAAAPASDSLSGDPFATAPAPPGPLSLSGDPFVASPAFAGPALPAGDPFAAAGERARSIPPAADLPDLLGPAPAPPAAPWPEAPARSGAERDPFAAALDGPGGGLALDAPDPPPARREEPAPAFDGALGLALEDLPAPRRARGASPSFEEAGREPGVVEAGFGSLGAIAEPSAARDPLAAAERGAAFEVSGVELASAASADPLPEPFRAPERPEGALEERRAPRAFEHAHQAAPALAAVAPPEPRQGPAQEPRPEPKERSPSGVRIRAVAVNAAALVALVGAALFILAVWRTEGPLQPGALRPAALLSSLRGEPESPGPFGARGVHGGLYERDRAPPLLFVRGTVVSRAAAPVRAVAVSVEIVRDGRVLARGEAIAGALPNPEELYGATDAAALARALRAAAARAPREVRPGDAIPFLVAIGDAPPDVEGASVRVVAAPVKGSSP